MKKFLVFVSVLFLLFGVAAAAHADAMGAAQAKAWEPYISYPESVAQKDSIEPMPVYIGAYVHYNDIYHTKATADNNSDADVSFYFSKSKAESSSTDSKAIAKGGFLPNLLDGYGVASKSEASSVDGQGFTEAHASAWADGNVFWGDGIDGVIETTDGVMTESYIPEITLALHYELFTKASAQEEDSAFAKAKVWLKLWDPGKEVWKEKSQVYVFDMGADRDRDMGTIYASIDPEFLYETGSVYFKYGVDTWAKANAVPEPATMLLLGIGLLGVVGFSRRTKLFRKI